MNAMTTTEKITLWVGIISLLLLVICTILFLWYRKRNEIDNTSKKSNQPTKDSQKEAFQYSNNERLDGARVSHRRYHPDRVQEQQQWKEQKAQEESFVKQKMEQDKSNKMLKIYSPCNADVAAIFASKEEATMEGYEKPGFLLTPNDDKLCAPINGVITWDKDNDAIIHVESQTGVKLTLHCKNKESGEYLTDCFTLKVDAGKSVAYGEMICRFQTGIIKRNHKSTQVFVEITSYRESQLLLVKHFNYVSPGDKIMTLRLDTNQS